MLSLPQAPPLPPSADNCTLRGHSASNDPFRSPPPPPYLWLLSPSDRCSSYHAHISFPQAWLVLLLFSLHVFLSVFIFIFIIAHSTPAPLTLKLIPVTQLLSRAHGPHLQLLDGQFLLLSLLSQLPSKLSKSSDFCTSFSLVFFPQSTRPPNFPFSPCPPTNRVTKAC